MTGPSVWSRWHGRTVICHEAPREVCAQASLHQSVRAITRACSLMPMTLKNAATRRCTSTNCTCRPSACRAVTQLSRRAGRGEVDADQAGAGDHHHVRARQLVVQHFHRLGGVAQDLPGQFDRHDVRHLRAQPGRCGVAVAQLMPEDSESRKASPMMVWPVA